MHKQIIAEYHEKGLILYVSNQLELVLVVGGGRVLRSESGIYYYGKEYILKEKLPDSFLSRSPTKNEKKYV